MGLVVAALLTACGRAPVPDGYDFVTHSLGPGAMTALLEGSLVINGGPESGGYCVVVVQGSRDVPFVAWPEHFRLVLADDGSFEVRGDGKVFRQGGWVRLGGGEISSGVHHSIPGACPALHYFAAQEFPD